MTMAAFGIAARAPALRRTAEILTAELSTIALYYSNYCADKIMRINTVY